MLFNSWLFLLIFLPATFFLYWFGLKNKTRHQNVLLLIEYVTTKKESTALVEYLC